MLLVPRPAASMAPPGAAVTASVTRPAGAQHGRQLGACASALRPAAAGLAAAAAAGGVPRRGRGRKQRSTRLARDAAGASAAGAAPAAERPLAELLRLAAATDRGQRLTEALRLRSAELLAALEAESPTPAPARSGLLEGEWRLAFASEDITRSSPFFWACRRLGLKDPTPFSSLVLGSDDLIETTFKITDNIPLTYMGVATQRLESGTLVNQVGVGVFITGESQMTTTCAYEQDPADPTTLLLTVQKTQVLGTSMAANVLRDISFPSGNWFQDYLGEDEAKVRMRITYLDEKVRIVRDGSRPSACFVYVRVD